MSHLNNFPVAFKISSYKVFVGVLFMGELLGIPIATLIIFLIKDVNLPTLIFSTTTSVVVMVPNVASVVTLVSAKFGSVELSQNGINGFSRLSWNSFVQWETVSEVKLRGYPGLKSLVITDDNRRKTSVPLFLDNIEQFRVKVIQFAGESNPCAQALKDLPLSEPPKLRVSSSHRSSLRKRLTISIPMGIIFLLVAGFVWINGWFLSRDVLASLKLLENVPASVTEYCYNISRSLMLWVYIFWPFILFSSAIIPPSLVFLSFRKKVIIITMGFCIFASVGFYAAGIIALFLAC